MPQKKPKGQPRTPARPSRKEVPVPLQPEPTSDMPPGDKPKWGLSRLDLDHNGRWSWGMATSEVLREIAAFLGNMEKSTWAEIQAFTHSGNRSGTHRNHKLVPTESLCREAQERLRQIRLDHLDELFEFRVRGKPRLWGYARKGVFYVVWWDPDHQVYPLDPP